MCVLEFGVKVLKAESKQGGSVNGGSLEDTLTVDVLSLLADNLGYILDRPAPHFFLTLLTVVFKSPPVQDCRCLILLFEEAALFKGLPCICWIEDIQH